jgi:uncharacterized membrane protein YeaQ/YmgE (transglycosylase-associated protein family)
MSFISTIICGLVVGVIAKFIMPGDNEPKGFILTSILGILGSLLAGYAGPLVGIYDLGDGIFWWIGSIVGAIVVLAVYGMVTKKNAA